MFGPLGMPELILIFVVAMLLFGPRQLPQIGKSIGRALGEFRRASNEFKRSIEDEVAADDVRQVNRDLGESLAIPPPAGPCRPRLLPKPGSRGFLAGRAGASHRVRARGAGVTPPAAELASGPTQIPSELHG